MAIGLVAVAILAVGWAYLAAEGPAGRADPDDPAQVALGERVYAEHCASCHGARLEGQPNWRQRLPSGRLPAPPHDETGHTWHHPDDLLFGLTKQGTAFMGMPDYESDMPAFAETLDDDQIWAVLAFIKSAWPPEIRARQKRIDELARQQ